MQRTQAARSIGCYAYIGADGRFVADSTFKTEDEVWRVVLGWPTRGEVRAAKQRGDRVQWIEVAT